jgi:hypothetical protein
MPSLFYPTIGMGRKDFATCLPVLPPSLTLGKAQASDQTNLGVFTADKHCQPRGLKKQWP